MAEKHLRKPQHQPAGKPKKLKNKHSVKPKTPIYIEESMSIERHLRKSSYNELLGRVRKQLPKKRHRILSRFIHAQGMDTFNDLLTHTIGKPIAIIVGSLFALVGVGVGVYLARSNGYSYNYLTLFLFFALGYVLSLLAESVVNFFYRSK